MKFYKVRAAMLAAIALIASKVLVVELPPVVSAVAIVVRDDGEVLFVKLSYSGGDALPGGIVQKGETAEEAVKRELCEETGLIAKNIDYLFSVSSQIRGLGTLGMYYLVHATGEIRKSREGVPYWGNPREAMRRLVYAANRAALELLRLA